MKSMRCLLLSVFLSVTTGCGEECEYNRTFDVSPYKGGELPIMGRVYVSEMRTCDGASTLWSCGCSDDGKQYDCSCNCFPGQSQIVMLRGSTLEDFRDMLSTQAACPLLPY